MEKLRFSENNRYFITSDGKPFVWLADTAWTMPQRMKWDDVDYYMQMRKSQGFTVLQIVALDPERDLEMHNPAGVPALKDGNLDCPNEEYFAYLDWILKKAEAYGFYVLLLPVWGQLVVGDDWAGGTFEKTVTKENAYRYGEWIGSRYRDCNHILWCLGGDRMPIHKGTDYRPVWRQMAEGLAKGLTGETLHYNEPNPLWRDLMITYHACHEAETGECSTMSYWDDSEQWISFIMLQSGHGLAPKNYEIVQREYERERTLPVWDGEPAYEMMPTTWPVTEGGFHGTWIVRRRAYGALLAGAFGHTYGHASVWCMISERERDMLCKYDWFEAIHSEGGTQIRYVRDVLEQLSLMTWIPCQEALPVQEDDAVEKHIQAAKSPESDKMCVYFPSGGQTEIDFSKAMPGAGGEKIMFWYYNPRTGEIEQKEEAQIPAEGTLPVCTPDSGEEYDWLLIAVKGSEEIPIVKQTYYDFQETGEGKKVFEWA